MSKSKNNEHGDKKVKKISRRRAKFLRCDGDTGRKKIHCKLAVTMIKSAEYAVSGKRKQEVRGENQSEVDSGTA